MIRIIAGRLKGRKIPVVKKSNYRPSTSRLKEAIFSILISSFNNHSLLSQAKVLDLFTGSGNLAFEALSRGVKHVTLIDNNLKHLNAIRTYAIRVNENDKMTFLKLDATNLPIAPYSYNIVFIDPPFYNNLINKTLLSLYKKRWLENGAILFIESEKYNKLELPAHFHLQEERIYGKSKLAILYYLK